MLDELFRYSDADGDRLIVEDNQGAGDELLFITTADGSLVPAQSVLQLYGQLGTWLQTAGLLAPAGAPAAPATEPAPAPATDTTATDTTATGGNVAP